jgi:hypothetical protein
VRLSPIVRTSYIMGKFSFGEEQIGSTCGMALRMHVHE